MPIYEFYCAGCHRVYSFLSRAVDTHKTPACPRCGQPQLTRRPSAFAISKSRPEPQGPGGEAETDPLPGLDDSRLERAMESLAAEADQLDENDPRAQARLMRRLFDAAGVPVQGGMQEALRRLEAGEDPDAVEAELGDAFDEHDPLAVGSTARPALARLRRQLPPSVDPGLYEM